MAVLDNLRNQGWCISTEGLSKICDNEADVKNIIRKVLDVDIRDFGAPIIASEITKSTFGPACLQILKIRNISASKGKPNSQAAPRMLKLILTDGHTTCHGIEIKHLSALSVDKTVPGTKLLINGARVVSGSLLLEPNCVKVLGGNVPALVEKWELSKLMPSHIRHTENGPPAWVNFGKKIVTNINNHGFKSLEDKNKDSSKENADFQVQRQDAIAEAAQGAVKKVFGGGVKPAQTFNSDSNSFNNNQTNQRVSRDFTRDLPRDSRPIKNKGKDKSEPEKIEKPSQRVSLFDFLEDKLPPDTNQTKSNQNSKNNDSYAPKVVNNDYSAQRNRVDNSQSRSESFRGNQKFSKLQNHYTNRQEPETKPKYSSENRYQNDRFENRNQTKPENRYQGDRNENRFQNGKSENKYQRDKPEHRNDRFDRYQNDKPEGKYQNNQPENRYQNDKPEFRYQNDKPEGRYQNDKPEFKYQNDKPEPRYQYNKPENKNQADRLRNKYQPENRYHHDRPENKFTGDRNERYPSDKSENRYQPDRSENRHQLDRSENRYQHDRSEHKYHPDKTENTYQSDKSDRYSTDKTDTKYQNDRPPRFQKKNEPTNKPVTQNEPRSKPNTNIFVDKLTNEINNISLYNSKYETEKLHKPTKNQESTSSHANTTWKWNMGDRCMAKYWEDNKFYNAVITGITNRTCMVEFTEYGNFEEVLHCDCIPLMTEKQENQHMNKPFTDNQEFSGSLEFRRGKSRPFVRTPNKMQGQDRNYES